MPRRKRAQELARKYGVTRKVFAERTPFSENQYQYWFGRGGKVSAPSAKQISVVCEIFDWSPTYIFFGIGPEKLSDVEKMHEADEVFKLAVENHEMLKEVLKRVS